MTAVRTHKGKTATYSYASLSDLVADLSARVTGKGRGESSQGYRSDSWDLGAGFDGAMELARTGWSDVRTDVAGMVANIESDLHAVDLRPAPVWDVAGAFVDVPEYLAGMPECMVTFSDVEVPARRVVRMLWNGTGSAITSAETLLRRGAAACALVEILEQSGFSVELTVCMAFTGGDVDERTWQPPAGARNVTQTVLAKPAGDPLDMDRFMFAAAHPAYLRRLLFAFQERVLTDAEWSDVNRHFGYGRPIAVSMEGYDVGCGTPCHMSDLVADDPVGWITGQLGNVAGVAQ